MGEFADVRFGQACVEQRRKHFMLARRLLARTPVSLVIYIHAIGDGGEMFLRSKGVELVKKFVFAEKTAVRIVGPVGRVRKFVGFNKLVTEIDTRNAFLRRLAVARGIARRKRGDSKHALT